MAMTIYVYSNGAEAMQLLNAVSAFFGSGDLNVALGIALTFSFVAAVWHYITAGHDVKTFVKWLAVYMIVSCILVKPASEPVQIIDATDPMGTYVVDNVPIGIALPAMFTTGLLYGLTQDIESVYHTPNELDYSQTGMLFGSKLVGVSTQSQIYNSQTQGFFNQFIANCIIPDVDRGKYQFSDLSNSTDLQTFFDQQNLSPLFGLYINGSFSTCQQAWPILKGMLNGQTTSTMAAQAAAMFPGNQQQQANFTDDVASAYNYYFTNLAQSSAQLMQQNIMVNAIINGGLSLSSSTDAMAAQINYATASSDSRMTESLISGGQLMAQYLPLMQTVLFMFWIGLFPLVVILATFHNFTFPILKNYVFGMLFLATWPLSFDILNYIINMVIENDFSSYTGMTISNISSLTQTAYRTEAACGYFMAVSPMLILWLMGKGYAGMASMVQSMGGAAHAFSSTAAAEAAAGNISMGNTSMDTHSFNSTSGNKFDTNAYTAYGKTSIQTPTGAIASQMPDGTDAYDASPALSHLPASMSTSQMVQSAIQNRYSKDMSTSHSLQAEQSALLTDTMVKAEQLQRMESNGETVGTGASYGDQSHMGNTLNSLVDNLKSYSQNYNTSHEQDSTFHTSAGVGVNGGASAGLNLGIAEVKGGISAHMGADAFTNDRASSSLSNQQQNSTDVRNSIGNDISSLSQAATNTHGELTNTQSQQLVNDIQNNWNRIQQLHQQESVSLQDAQSMQSAYDSTKSAGFSINDESINNLVLDSARSSRDPLILDAVTNPNPTENQRVIRDNFAQSVIEGQVLPNFGAYTSASSGIGGGAANIQGAFAAQSSALSQSGTEAVNNAFGSNNTSISGQYQPNNSVPSYSSVMNTAEGKIANAATDMQVSSQTLTQNNQAIQSVVNTDQSKMADNAQKGALHTLGDQVASADIKMANLTGLISDSQAGQMNNFVNNQNYKNLSGGN